MYYFNSIATSFCRGHRKMLEGQDTAKKSHNLEHVRNRIQFKDEYFLNFKSIGIRQICKFLSNDTIVKDYLCTHAITLHVLRKK